MFVGMWHWHPRRYISISAANCCYNHSSARILNFARRWMPYTWTFCFCGCKTNPQNMPRRGRKDRHSQGRHIFRQWMPGLVWCKPSLRILHRARTHRRWGPCWGSHTFCCRTSKWTKTQRRNPNPFCTARTRTFEFREPYHMHLCARHRTYTRKLFDARLKFQITNLLHWHWNHFINITKSEIRNKRNCTHFLKAKVSNFNSPCRVANSSCLASLFLFFGTLPRPRIVIAMILVIRPIRRAFRTTWTKNIPVLSLTTMMLWRPLLISRTSQRSSKFSWAKVICINASIGANQAILGVGFWRVPVASLSRLPTNPDKCLTNGLKKLIF